VKKDLGFNAISIIFGLLLIAWGTLVLKGIVPHSRGCDSGYTCIITAFLNVLLMQMILVDYRYYNYEVERIRKDKISFFQAICTTLSIFGIFGIFMYAMDTLNSKNDILFIVSLTLIFVCSFVRDKIAE